jgi:hypothetical protein
VSVCVRLLLPEAAKHVQLAYVLTHPHVPITCVCVKVQYFLQAQQRTYTHTYTYAPTNPHPRSRSCCCVLVQQHTHIHIHIHIHLHTHIHIHSHTQHASTSPHTHVPQDEWSLDRTVSLAGANNTHTPTTTMPSHPHVLGICGCVIVRKFLEVPTTHSYTYTYTYTLPQPTYPHIQTYQGYVVVQPYNVCRS